MQRLVGGGAKETPNEFWMKSQYTPKTTFHLCRPQHQVVSGFGVKEFKGLGSIQG